MTRQVEAAEPMPASSSSRGRYNIGANLGRGSFGEVFQATDTVTGDEVAVKRIFIRDPEKGLPVNVQREFKCLQLVDHPNVVRILDVLAAEQHVLTVLELCERDVYSVLRDAVDAVPPAIVKRWLRETLRGVAAIHRAGIIHRDLKPSNLMLTAAGAVKITDFGQARPMAHSGGTYSATAASQAYRAPEVLFSSHTYDGAAADMWSVGCTFAELLGKTVFFRAASEMQQLSCIFHVLGTYEPAAWGGAEQLPDFSKIRFGKCAGVDIAALLPSAPASAIALLRGLLAYNPAQRPCAEKALQHAYFAEEPACASDAQMHWFLASLPARPVTGVGACASPPNEDDPFSGW